MQTEITDQLLRRREAGDVADRSDQGDGDDHVHTGDGHQPPDVVAGQRMPGEIALDPLQILAEAVDLAYVALDRQTLVLRQRLHREPGPAFPIEQVGRRAWRDQVPCRIDWMMFFNRERWRTI